MEFSNADSSSSSAGRFGGAAPFSTPASCESLNERAGERSFRQHVIHSGTAERDRTHWRLLQNEQEHREGGGLAVSYYPSVSGGGEKILTLHKH